MKKYIFLITILFLVFKNSYARSGIGGSGMVIDRETFGGEGHDGIAFPGFSIISEGFGGNGRIMSDFPGSFDIGGFDGIRTIELPTSFEGNIGGRF